LYILGGSNTYTCSKMFSKLELPSSVRHLPASCQPRHPSARWRLAISDKRCFFFITNIVQNHFLTYGRAPPNHGVTHGTRLREVMCMRLLRITSAKTPSNCKPSTSSAACPSFAAPRHRSTALLLPLLYSYVSLFGRADPQLTTASPN
jgi:hypothetical protein